MFNRIGKTIKGIAKALFAIYVVIGFIASIVAAYAIGGEAGFVVFLAVLCISVFSAYVFVMFIYAIGSITDDLHMLKAKMCGDVDSDLETENVEERITEEIIIDEEKYCALLDKLGQMSDEELRNVIKNSSDNAVRLAANEVIEGRKML